MDIRQKYNAIEKNFHENENKALKEMIDLYCYAANSYEHDIADAINLYICDMGDKDIYNYLETKLTLIDHDDDYLKNEFKQWMKMIKNKNTNS